MRVRIILAGFFLSLAVVTVTKARPQTGVPSEGNQKERDSKAQTAPQMAAALRSQVAKLRAEVELLEIEHDVNKALLVETLKAQGLDPAAKLAAEGTEQADRMRIRMFAGRIRKLAEIDRELGVDERALPSQIEQEAKDLAESHRAALEGTKKAFVSQTTKLNEKRLELAELETQLLNAK